MTRLPKVFVGWCVNPNVTMPIVDRDAANAWTSIFFPARNLIFHEIHDPGAVIPAKAGIHVALMQKARLIPAFAGMTSGEIEAFRGFVTIGGAD